MGRPLAYLGFTPNPTRGPLDAVFDLPTTQVVTARIFDARGRLVRDLGEGNLARQWDRTDRAGVRVAPGLYFAEVVAGGKREARPVTVLP